MQKLVLVLIALALLILASVFGLRHASRNPQDLSLQDLGQAAGESYVYGYPLLLMEQTRRVTLMTPAGPDRDAAETNRFNRIRAFPTADFRTVVRPNVDTLYTIGWLDLSQGPVVMQVPEMGDRYYQMPILDAWTNVIASPGTRTTGNRAGRFLLALEGWAGDVPEDMTRIDSPTAMNWIIGRIQTDGRADYAAVHALQDGFLLSPLEPDSPGPLAETFEEVDLSLRTPDQLAGMGALDSFARLDALLLANPPAPADGEAVARLRRLGLLQSSGFKNSSYGPLARAAMNRGVSIARERLAQALDARPYGPTGWRTPDSAIGRYGNNYGLRAGVALLGLGANEVEDAVYPGTEIDQTGATLSGDRRYRIHFAADALPPVDAFWSVTLYDREGFLVHTPQERHALTSRDPLIFNEDGSLTLYVGAEPEASVPQANWLPAPAGAPFVLTARLYWPRAEILDGRWQMPPVEPLP